MSSSSPRILFPFEAKAMTSFGLVFEALRPPLPAIRYQVLPHELDHARIVVAVCEIVIQRRKAMPLASLLHVLELSVFKLVMINISPVIS
jgi:hypothetical protein